MSISRPIERHPLESDEEDDSMSNTSLTIDQKMPPPRPKPPVLSGNTSALQNSDSQQSFAAVKLSLTKPADTAVSYDSISNGLSSLPASSSSLAEFSLAASAENATNALMNTVVPKPKVAKRIAPRLPPAASPPPPANTKLREPLQNMAARQEEERFTNFYIEIEQVRWFYKYDKEPTPATIPSSLSSTTSVNNFQTTTVLNPSNSSCNLSNETAFTANETAIAASNLNSPTDPASPSIIDISNNGSGSTATAPTSTIHTSKKWNMFSKWDSINLELEYRDVATRRSSNNSQTDPKLVQVLDNLFEVNMLTKKCYPIYWKQTKTMTVRRCIWFNNANEPLDEKVGEEIERKHVELFRDSMLSSECMLTGQTGSLNSSSSESSSLKLNDADDISTTTGGKSSSKKDEAKHLFEPIGTLSFDDGTITWYASDEIYYGKNKPSFFNYIVGLGSKMGSKLPGATGTRIRRGFKDAKSEMEERPKEITHVVFVIHGIAQKLYENSIIKNCEDLRKECEKKKRENFAGTHDHLRYIFIPVDWRSSLILDDGIIETITPVKIQTIREKLNSSALDIMYYTSPLFRTEIINSLTAELNRLYNLFCQKNPNFKNKEKISFVAHSLGTVITYDILTASNSTVLLSNAYGEDQKREKIIFDHFSENDSKLVEEYQQCRRRMQEIEMSLLRANKNITALEFKAENLFLFGSPLAVFLALRGVRPAGVGTQDHILPKHICKRLFNIFHPCDPIAYRLEPLILKHYASKSPLEIQRGGGVCYREMNEKRSAVSVDLKSTLSKGVNKKKDKDAKSAELSTMKEEAATTTGASKSGQIDQVELEAALDYQIQDSSFELVAAIRAHIGYWKSSDVGMFIMHQLCLNDYDPGRDKASSPPK